MTIIKTENIESVQIFNWQELTYYKWVESKKFLWFTWGGYFTFFGTEVSNEEILKSKRKIENNKVFARPYLDIRMLSGDSHTPRFDSLEEAEKFRNECFSIHKRTIEL